MTPDWVEPSDVRYIKLGDGGRWARAAIEGGYVAFGYPGVPPEVCGRKDWQQVGQLLSHRKSSGAITAGVTEVRAFYEMGQDCLWITFADGHLWWAFANPEVVWLGDGADGGPSRMRRVLGRWKNTDLSNQPLRSAALSSKLTQVANFRGTICEVGAKDYMLRRINGVEEPILAEARDARRRLIEVAAEMIRNLHWADFETLADLIFFRSGWQRSARLGGTLADADILMEQPSTGERAFVQVKSRADQSILDDYLQRFHQGGYERFFFICHSAKGDLCLPPDSRTHLLAGGRLAEAAVRNGLYDWLMERSG